MFKRYIAFTLAEVLITLGIIGVVAAMTIPTLISKYQEKATITKVKKLYSTLSQAIIFSMSENGQPNIWSISGKGEVTNNSIQAQELSNYILPYIKISKNCGNSAGCLDYKVNPIFLNGQENTVNYDSIDRYYKIILSDGSYLWWRRNGAGTYCHGVESAADNICAVFFTDINGPSGPNKTGEDIFDIGFLTPNGLTQSPYNECNLQQRGWGCARYIITEGNMNYLKN